MTIDLENYWLFGNLLGHSWGTVLAGDIIEEALRFVVEISLGSLLLPAIDTPGHVLDDDIIRYR
jgi:hypothetical protein